MAVRLVDGGTTTQQLAFMSGTKWAATFPLVKFDWVCGMNLENSFIRDSILSKRRGNQNREASRNKLVKEGGMLEGAKSLATITP